MSRFRPTAAVRRNAFFRTVAKLSRKYLSWFGNASLRPERNGERWLLASLTRERLRTVVDVGANVGKWAALAAGALPEAAIYALEIVPATYERLRANTAGDPRVRAFNLGLADRPGVLSIRWNPDRSTHATVTEYPRAWEREERLACPVTTGDEFLRREGIERVDFLKIDVEGAENLVLEGFRDALAARRVRLVQFEYGGYNIYSRFLLRDFHDFFEARGYAVGKLFPDFVEFRPWQPSDEDFIGGNYVACPADDPLLAPLREGAAWLRG